MASFKPKQAPLSALVVFLFWGGSTVIFYADKAIDFYFVLAIIIAVVCGFDIAKSRSQGKRLAIKRHLSPHTLSGISSSLGPVPIHLEPLALAKTIDTKTLLEHFPKEYRNQTTKAINSYIDRYSVTHPHYVSLLESILMLLIEKDHIQYTASYDIDASSGEDIENTVRAHGDRKLLTHSLLVFALCFNQYENYCASYKPQKPRRAIDSEYKPDLNDPLPGLLGIAHDIGKLHTFRLVKDPQKGLLVKRVLRNHDVYGARVIAMLDAFWCSDIPDDERSILQNVLSCYHHPQSLPYEPSSEKSPEKNCSDRETALLEYLIKMDHMAGAIEGGMAIADALESSDNLAPTEEVHDSDDWVSLFIRFLAMNNDINLSAGQKSIAFKTELDGRCLLVFDELLFLNSFCHYLKKPNLIDIKVGKEAHPVTSNILNRLDGLEVVYRPDKRQTFGRPAELCIFRASFKNKESDLEPFLVIGSTFTLDITSWDALERVRGMKNINAAVTFHNCKFGNRGQRKDLGVEAVNEEITGETNLEPVINVLDIKKTASTKKTKERVPPTISGSVLNSMVRIAVTKGGLRVEKEIEVDGVFYFVLVGQDQWFINLGLMPEKMKDLVFMSEAKILEVKDSKTMPGTSVIVIAK